MPRFSIDFARLALFASVGGSLLLAGCQRPPPSTAPGTRLVEWKRGPTSWETGVSLGEEIGAEKVTTTDVTFTPATDRADRANAGKVVLEVRVARDDVRVNANDAGERPSEVISAPRSIDITVRNAGAWRATATCQDKPSYPMAAREPRAVTLAEECNVELRAPHDSMAGIMLNVVGDGRLDTLGSFGKTTTTP